MTTPTVGASEVLRAQRFVRNMRDMVKADGIDSVELQDGDGKTILKVEGKGKRKGREGAPT